MDKKKLAIGIVVVLVWGILAIIFLAVLQAASERPTSRDLNERTARTICATRTVEECTNEGPAVVETYYKATCTCKFNEMDNRCEPDVCTTS